MRKCFIYTILMIIHRTDEEPFDKFQGRFALLLGREGLKKIKAANRIHCPLAILSEEWHSNFCFREKNIWQRVCPTMIFVLDFCVILFLF